jgi:hypothetical protein
MNGLIIFIGESFRVGTQGTRNRGSAESYPGQIGACNSHIRFIEHIITAHNLNSISVHISSYTTQYDNDLLAIYDKYLIGRDYYDNPIGISTLFQNAIQGFGLGMGSSIARNIFETKQPVIINPPANSNPLTCYEYIKCLKLDDYSKSNCLSNLEKNEFTNCEKIYK